MNRKAISILVLIVFTVILTVGVIANSAYHQGVSYSTHSLEPGEMVEADLAGQYIGISPSPVYNPLWVRTLQDYPIILYTSFAGWLISLIFLLERKVNPF